MDPDSVTNELEQRLRNGEWLGTAELAILFGRDRSTIWRWAKKSDPPRIPYRDLDGWELVFDPVETLRLLARRRLRHDGTDREPDL